MLLNDISAKWENIGRIDKSLLLENRFISTQLIQVNVVVWYNLPPTNKPDIVWDFLANRCIDLIKLVLSLVSIGNRSGCRKTE